MKGTYLSITLWLVNNPCKLNIPNKGSISISNTVNNDLMTLSSLIRLKIIITQNKINDINKCDFSLKPPVQILVFQNPLCQYKDVVRGYYRIKHLNSNATIPNKKIIPTN